MSLNKVSVKAQQNPAECKTVLKALQDLEAALNAVSQLSRQPDTLN
jgi:hypothetical protein